MKTNSLTRIFLTCLMGAATCSSAMAQTVASGAVTIDNVQTNVENKRVDVAFRLNLNNLKLKAEQQLILTPLLAADGDTTALQPIIINGRSQQIRMQRAGKLDAKNTEGEQPIVVLRKNGTEQSIIYSQSVERMRPVEADQLQVLAAQDLCGCGDLKNQDRTLITTIDNLGAWMPALAFVKPAAEARKQRAEKGEAYLASALTRPTSWLTCSTTHANWQRLQRPSTLCARTRTCRLRASTFMVLPRPTVLTPTTSDWLASVPLR